MKMSISARLVLMMGLVGLAAAWPRAETRTSNAMNAKEQANLTHVRNWWLECLEGRNLEATAKYQADSYIQHNINFPTGRAGFWRRRRSWSSRLAEAAMRKGHLPRRLISRHPTCGTSLGSLA